MRDRAGKGKPLDLRIHGQGARRVEGGIRLTGKSNLLSVGPANRLNVAIERSGEVTLEAWIRPANTQQSGPARIVTLSKDSTNRNMTLGQDGNKYDVRFRSAKTSFNGIPSLSSPAKLAEPKLQHVVFTRHRNGDARIYVNGKQVIEKKIGGGLYDWDPSYKLSIGDEVSGGRRWQGVVYLVALYNRGLTREEVRNNFEVGHEVKSSTEEVEDDANNSFFVQKVAPILAEHCLECHDAPNSQGGLDLSHKLAALKGGERGQAIVPGNSAGSELFQLVQEDDMPIDRQPLSEDEKEVLRRWIDDGANWPMEFVDPALFAHGGGSSARYIRRLTTDEYVATVKAVFAVDIEREAKQLLPKDLRADGFNNTSYNLNVDLKHIESYARLAEKIVAQLDVGQFIRRFDKSPKFTDKTMGKLIDQMGRWVLRGSVTEEETIAYRGISTTVASAGGKIEEAVGYILEAMLQSPRFVYRLENQLGDGTYWPVGENELAVRIAYIVWGAPPDERLYQAARNGDLYDPNELEKQVERMFLDPRARAQAGRFVSGWLNLQGLKNLSPSRSRFPKWDSELAADMQEETLAYFQHIAWDEDRPLAELLNSPIAFVTPRLAKHYNLPLPNEQQQAEGPIKVDLTQNPTRGGLLTQGSVLTIGGDDASTVTRGLFVLHDLLRGVVKDPPPCVDTTPIATEPGLTQRMIATTRIQNESCGGCHSKFEPLAFALEKFDGLGTFQEKDEHENELREDGEVLIPGEAKAVSYETSRELMNLLAQNKRVQQSLTWKVVQFALGRPLTIDDAKLVDQVHTRAQQHGGSYRQIIKALVANDLVQFTLTEEESQE